jgi:uncharacterized membrane protein
MYAPNMGTRRIVLLLVVALLMAGALAGGFLLGQREMPVEEKATPTNSPSLVPEPDASECQRVALRLRSLLRDWRDIWDPVFEAAREDLVPAKRWRRSASRFSVLEARVESLVVTSELEQSYTLTTRSIHEARELFDVLAQAVESGQSDEQFRARQLTLGDRARELWIAADRNLDRHPCSR